MSRHVSLYIIYLYIFFQVIIIFKFVLDAVMSCFEPITDLFSLMFSGEANEYYNFASPVHAGLKACAKSCNDYVRNGPTFNYLVMLMNGLCFCKPGSFDLIKLTLFKKTGVCDPSDCKTLSAVCPLRGFIYQELTPGINFTIKTSPLKLATNEPVTISAEVAGNGFISLIFILVYPVHSIYLLYFFYYRTKSLKCFFVLSCIVTC